MMHRYTIDIQKAEIEAETVAHFVCGSQGLSTDPYTVGYLASWCDGSIELVERYLSSDALTTTADKIRRWIS